MAMRKLSSAAILWISLLVVLASPLQATPQSSEIASPERTFIGPDGNPLPFKNDAEVMEFLKTAAVIDEKPIGQGINRSLKALLEKDGVRAYAAFREADRTERDAYVGGSPTGSFATAFSSSLPPTSWRCGSASRTYRRRYVVGSVGGTAACRSRSRTCWTKKRTGSNRPTSPPGYDNSAT